MCLNPVISATSKR